MMSIVRIVFGFCVQVIFCVLLSVVFNNTAAQTLPVDVVFVNGIQNTVLQAISTRLKIQKVLDASALHVVPNRKNFLVSVVWNPIGWYGVDGLETLPEDLAELFLLKTAEEHYSSSMIKILAPINSVPQLDVQAAKQVAVYLDDMTPGGNYLELLGVGDKEINATKRAINSLVDVVTGLNSAIVVAHSEGNLLANLAWAKIVSEKGQFAANHYRIVNVANTSLFSVNGLDLTHEGDVALFNLKGLAAAISVLGISAGPDLSLVGGVGGRITPMCSGLCSFKLAEPMFGAGIDLDVGMKHGMDEVYLSDKEVPLALNSYGRGIGFSPGATKFVNRFEDLVYVAAYSLEDVAAIDLPVDYPAFAKAIVDQQTLDESTNLIRKSNLPGNSTDWMIGYYYGTDLLGKDCNIHVAQGGIVTFVDANGSVLVMLDGEKNDSAHVEPGNKLGLAAFGFEYGYWGFSLQVWQNQSLDENGVVWSFLPTAIELDGAGGQLQWVKRKGPKSNECWIRYRSQSSFGGKVGLPSVTDYKFSPIGAVPGDISSVVLGREFLGYAVGGMSPTSPMPSPCVIKIDGVGTVSVSADSKTWSASINGDKGDKNSNVVDSNGPLSQFGYIEYGNPRYVYGITAAEPYGDGGAISILFEFHSSATTFSAIGARVIKQSTVNEPIVIEQTCYVYR